MNPSIQIINRTTAPELKVLDRIKIIEAQKQQLDNGIDFYTINAGTQNVIKLDFIFEAGEILADKKVIAQAANHLIDDGTSTKSSQQIAEELESYGASFDCRCDVHEAFITVFTLNKFLHPVLKIIYETITDAIYPEEELKIYALRNKQQLLVSAERVNYLAQKMFRQKLFGETHPYGISQEPEDFDLLDNSLVKDFYKNQYVNRSFKIIASGKINTDTFEIVNQLFGKNKFNTELKNNFDLLETVQKPEILKLKASKAGAVQNAIRIGKIIPGRRHEDYPLLSLLTTLLGGYFGSRLMTNIREEKGYTYGIGAGIVNLKKAAFFTISTEVGAEVCDAALKEIYLEIEKLRTEKIPSEELQVVKNYMQGSFLRNIDGPFALSDLFKNLLLYDQDYEYHQNYLQQIKNADSNSLLTLAKKHFNTDEMLEVIAGNFSNE